MEPFHRRKTVNEIRQDNLRNLSRQEAAMFQPSRVLAFELMLVSSDDSKMEMSS